MKKTLGSLGLVLLGSLLTLTVVFAEGGYAPDFEDVDYDAYYGNSIQEMAGRNIITGYENGTYGPDDPVTRGQMATILDRYDEDISASDLRALICTGLSEDDFPTDHAYFGDTQSTFQELCPQEAP